MTETQEEMSFLSREELNPRWFQQAMCQRVTYLQRSDFYYAGRFKNGSPALREHESKLRSCCESCPVMDACDEWADRHACYAGAGWWGGISERERRQRARERDA